MEVIDSDKVPEESKWIRISAWILFGILLLTQLFIVGKITLEKLNWSSLLPDYALIYSNAHLINFGLISSIGTILGFVGLLLRKNLFALIIQMLFFFLGVLLMYRVFLYEIFLPN